MHSPAWCTMAHSSSNMSRKVAGQPYCSRVATAEARRSMGTVHGSSSADTCARRGERVVAWQAGVGRAAEG